MLLHGLLALARQAQAVEQTSAVAGDHHNAARHRAQARSQKVGFPPKAPPGRAITQHRPACQSVSQS
eukprot:6499871-Pyramimonas_sp.AAC.1